MSYPSCVGPVINTHRAVIPPSTAYDAPVANEESVETNQLTIPTKSRGSPIRPSGVSRIKSGPYCGSSQIFFISGVAIVPGTTTFDRTQTSL